MASLPRIGTTTLYSSGTCNLYTKPNESSTVLKTFPKGKVSIALEVTDIVVQAGSVWIEIIWYDGKDGWVITQYKDKAPPSELEIIEVGKYRLYIPADIVYVDKGDQMTQAEVDKLKGKQSAEDKSALDELEKKPPVGGSANGDSGNAGKLGTGAIVGIVLAVLAVVGGIIWAVRKK